MDKKKPFLTSVWKQRIGLYGGILLIILAAAMFSRWYNLSNSVQLTVPPVEFSWQSERFAATASPPTMTDARWKSDPIGETGYIIGDAGSLVCALSIDADGRTPGEINRDLHAAYSQNGHINWQAANVALMPMQYTLLETLEPNAALEGAKKNQTVLLAVADDKNNALWLYLCEIANGEYVIWNPQSGQIEMLSQHGRVFMIVIGEQK